MHRLFKYYYETLRLQVAELVHLPLQLVHCLAVILEKKNWFQTSPVCGLNTTKPCTQRTKSDTPYIKL
jgi:hypothetical protein